MMASQRGVFLKYLSPCGVLTSKPSKIANLTPATSSSSIILKKTSGETEAKALETQKQKIISANNILNFFMFLSSRLES
jgi:hypothetical protein